MKLNSGGLSNEEKECLNVWMKNRCRFLGIFIVFWTISLLSFIIAYFCVGDRTEVVIGTFFSVVVIITYGVQLYMLKDAYEQITSGIVQIYRTQIEKKRKRFYVKHRNLYYTSDYCFDCEGYTEEVYPLTFRMFLHARVGDDITILKVRYLRNSWLSLGIIGKN